MRLALLALAFLMTAPVQAGTIAMRVVAPTANYVGPGCPDIDPFDPDGVYRVGTPLTDLKEILIRVVWLDAPGDTADVGRFPASPGETVDFDFSGRDGAQYELLSYAIDTSQNRACCGASYVGAFPATGDPPAGPAGLLAQYWDNPDFTGESVTAVDSLVDFACGSWPLSVAPIPIGGTIGPGYFAVRWTGFISIGAAGSWRFCVDSDDGARLWVDGAAVADRWSATGRGKACGSLPLSPGLYPIRLDYKQDGGGCLVRLLWTPPDGSEAVVPASEVSH